MTPTVITREQEQGGHEQVLQYPWTKEDVRRHEAEGKGLESWNTNLERASSSSVPRQGSSSSSPPAETNKRIHMCEHGVKALKPRNNGKQRNLDETDEIEARKRMAERLVPKYEVGEKVRFPSHDGEEWFHGKIQELILPGFTEQ
jgi:hypothetical protein